MEFGSPVGLGASALASCGGRGRLEIVRGVVRQGGVGRDRVDETWST